MFFQPGCTAPSKVARFFGSRGAKHWQKVAQLLFLILYVAQWRPMIQKVAPKSSKQGAKANFRSAMAAKSNPTGIFSPNLPTLVPGHNYRGFYVLFYKQI